MHQQTTLAQWIQQPLLMSLLVATMLVQAKLPGHLQNQAIQNNPPNQQIQANERPDGLSSPEWTSIQQQINASKYHAYLNPKGGYNSSNPAHGWQIRYSSHGTTTLRQRDKQTPSYHLGMKLKAIGYQTLQSLDKPQQISANDSTVTYQWNDNIKEWWINSPSRLEQWFSIAQRPTGASSGAPLTLQMTLDSELQAKQSGNNIHFINATGTNITYDKLKAWDATGRTLPAKMQLTNNILNLIVEDGDAHYPLTIDPSFQQQAYLKASNTGTNDGFGSSVAIAGNTIVVGAVFEASNATGVNGNQSDNSIYAAGAAYVFTRNGNTWSQQAYLKASNTGIENTFGSSVAIAGDTIVIGAAGEASNATGVNGDQSDNSAHGAGAAYVFTRSDDTWSQQAYLKASNTEADEWFGSSVAIAGDTVVVGATREDSNATGINGDQSDNSAHEAGAAYVFIRSDDTWSQQAYLKASNTEADDAFSSSVAIAGDTIVISAPGEASNATGINGDQSDNSAFEAGAAYVFIRSDDTWNLQAYLKASNTEADDAFGSSVAIAGDVIVIGASVEASNSIGINGDQSNNSTQTAGATYVFTRSGSTWSQQAYLKAFNTRELFFFGTATAIAGDTVVIGAFGDDSNATGINGDQSDVSAGISGAAYVFNLVESTGECTLDVDGNLSIDALTDGIMVIRYLFGSRGDSLTADAVASDCVNCSAAELEPILEQCAAASTSDIDDNGEVDALTDGLLIMRYLFGSVGDAVTEGSVANNCNRCNAPEIEVYLQGLLPLDRGLSDESQISGFAWLDNNADGLQSTGEPGFAKTIPDFGTPTVALYQEGSGLLIDAAVFDEISNGQYVFNVSNGNYYLCASNEFRELGLSVTTQNAGDDSIDNDFDGLFCTYGINVSEEQVVVRDLGLVGDTNDIESDGKISGVAWTDRNNNGVREEDENGLRAIVEIRKLPEQVGSFIQHTVSNEDGSYEFTNLQPGIYRVQLNASIFAETTVNNTENRTVNLPVLPDDNSVITNIIEVDGVSCKLQDALESAIAFEPVGGCVSTEPNLTAIILEAGSTHPSVEHGRGSLRRPTPTTENGISRPDIRLFGNGARIEEYSITANFSTEFRIGRASITNASLGSAKNSGSTLNLDHVTIDQSLFGDGIDGGDTPARFSTIGNSEGRGVRLSDSVVLGDVKGRHIINTRVEGTFFGITHGSSASATNSSINRLSANAIKITDSAIGGVFINEFSGAIPAECIDIDKNVDPVCLRN